MATITDHTGTVTTTGVRDINDKDKTLVVPVATAPVATTPVAPTRPTPTASARGVAVPIGPTARSSFWATVSLMFGIAAAFTALTGQLAGPAIGLGLIGAFAGLGGMSASSRPNVAGRGQALLGMFFGLAAVVIAVLAITGVLPAFEPDANPVGRFADWLARRLPWMFPS